MEIIELYVSVNVGPTPKPQRSVTDIVATSRFLPLPYSSLPNFFCLLLFLSSFFTFFFPF